MQRRPSMQDITWILDLNRNSQLDLNPPYQRRSVWTLKDKQYFLDTIFRNYPSPAIFLNKTIDDGGKATYHVVDGKQRTQTILDFVSNKIRINKDFGDSRLDGKTWSELAGDAEQKQKFWNYQLTIEQIDIDDGSVVKEVFGRLNKNARRLTPQELRHAKYEGWLISKVEKEAELKDWTLFGVVTKARATRMSDCQFISELMLVGLEAKVLGFDQNELDELYAKYEDPADEAPEFDEDALLDAFKQCKTYLHEMEDANQVVTQYAKALANFYTLWSFVALTPNIMPAVELAPRYAAFMQTVNLILSGESPQAVMGTQPSQDHTLAITYADNFRGANTDLPQRQARLDALRAAMR